MANARIRGIIPCLVLATALLGAACGPHTASRSTIDTAAARSTGAEGPVAAQLANEGYSVGRLLTATLPDGTSVAIFSPEPADGYAPQVTVMRLDGGRPVFETESVCDPFLFAVGVTSYDFTTLDPPEFTSVGWGGWDGVDATDLVVEIAAHAETGNQGYGASRIDLKARCVFRAGVDPGYGKVFAAVLPSLLSAEMESDYNGRTVTTESHYAAPVEGPTDTIDLTVTTQTTVCTDPGTGTSECYPTTTAVTSRYRLVGEGLEQMYRPMSEAIYYSNYPNPNNYGYPSPPVPDYRYQQPDTGVIQLPEITVDDPTAETYDGTATGYDGTATGYDGTATGYDGTATGYDGTATGYDGTATGYDDTATGSEEEPTGGE